MEGFAPDENLKKKTAEQRKDFENKKSNFEELDKAEKTNVDPNTENVNKTENKKQSTVVDGDEEFDRSTREILKKHCTTKKHLKFRKMICFSFITSFRLVTNDNIAIQNKHQ